MNPKYWLTLQWLVHLPIPSGTKSVTYIPRIYHPGNNAYLCSGNLFLSLLFLLRREKDGRMGGERERHRCPAHSTLPATLPINVPGFPRSHMLCCFDVTRQQLHSAASFYGKNIFKRADERDPISHFVSHYFNCIYIECIIYRGKLLSSL